MRVTGRGEGVVLEEAALSEKVNWSTGQAVEEQGKVLQVGRPVSFCCYCRHLLTFRSLCTMPLMWQ